MTAWVNDLATVIAAGDRPTTSFKTMMLVVSHATAVTLVNGRTRRTLQR